MKNEKALEVPTKDPQALGFLPTFMEQVLDTVERVLHKNDERDEWRA